MLVKAIDTLPAFAVSDLVLYASWPSRFASIGSALAELVEDEELVVAAGALVVVAGVLGVEELAVFEELPQPASVSRPTATARAESMGVERRFARPCASVTTGQLLIDRDRLLGGHRAVRILPWRIVRL
jgi:hypothetical protein